MKKNLQIFLILLIMTLCVACSSKEFTVSFDTDGGSSIENQIISKGKSAVEPPVPTKDGYTFVSWTLNDEKYDFYKLVTKDITLKATWKEAEEPTESDNKKEDNTPVTKYTVKFNSNGGSAVLSEEVERGTPVPKPISPVRTGYTFKGWTLDDKEYDFNSPITKDIVLKAKWEKNAPNPNAVKFVVSFDSNGGSFVPIQTIGEGEKAVKPTPPTKEGCVFVSWQLDGKNYNFNNVVTRNLTLRAIWRAATPEDKPKES